MLCRKKLIHIFSATVYPIQIFSIIIVVLLFSEFCFTAQDLDPIAVNTLPSVSLRRNRMTLVGAIQSNGLPVEYYFEYGLKGEGFALTSTRKTLRPNLGAYYVDEMIDVLSPSNTSGRSFTRSNGDFSYRQYYLYDKDIKADHLYNDRNHKITGTLNLISWLNTGKDGHQSVYLGGGHPDLRGAQMKLFMAGENFKPNGSEFIFWVQSCRRKAKYKRWEGPIYCANWGYKKYPMTKALEDGKWQIINFKITNNPHDWVFAGNNPDDPDTLPKYKYISLDETLADVNTDFIFLLAGVDENNPPTGRINIHKLILNYRNKSFLFPANGGRLLKFPKDSSEDPRALTDGWRNGDGQMWKSVENPDSPQEFIYELGKKEKIKIIQIHQNPQWPAKGFEIYSSLDGKEYELKAQGEIPFDKSIPVNQLFYITKNLTAFESKFIKLRIKSGYNSQFWGVGEIEVFGESSLLPTATELHYVNQDIRRLDQGKEYQYRLVAVNKGKKFYGEKMTFIAE